MATKAKPKLKSKLKAKTKPKAKAATKKMVPKAKEPAKRKGFKAGANRLEEVAKLPPGDLFKRARDRAVEVLGKSYASSVLYWLPTGCYLLDLAIMNGIPLGRFIELAGLEHSGKSALMHHIGQQAQMRGGFYLVMDVEGGFDEDLCHNICGVDPNPDRFYVHVTNKAELILDYIESIIVDAEECGSTTPFVIGIDSLAALVPQAFEGQSYTEAPQVGHVARLLSNFCRRNAVRLRSTAISIVCVNQMRYVVDMTSRFTKELEGPNPQKGKKTTTPGGMAVRHYCAVRLEINGEKDETVGTKETKRLVGATVEVKVIKNKVGQNKRRVIYPFFWRPDEHVLGIDDCMACIGYLQARKVLPAPSGGWFKIEGLLEKNVNRDQLRAIFYNNEAFRLAIWKLTRETFLIEHGVPMEEEDIPPAPAALELQPTAEPVEA